MGTFGLLLRLVVSLGVVFGLMAVAARAARRFGPGGGLALGTRRRSLPIEVVGRQALGKRAGVALVRAGGRGLVLGVTDHTVTVLAECDPDDLLPPPPADDDPLTAPRTGAAPSPWTALLDRAREATARR